MIIFKLQILQILSTFQVNDFHGLWEFSRKISDPLPTLQITFKEGNGIHYTLSRILIILFPQSKLWNDEWKHTFYHSLVSVFLSSGWYAKCVWEHTSTYSESEREWPGPEGVNTTQRWSQHSQQQGTGITITSPNPLYSESERSMLKYMYRISLLGLSRLTRAQLLFCCSSLKFDKNLKVNVSDRAN